MISKFENESLTQEDINSIFEWYREQRIKAVEEQYRKKYINDKDKWEEQIIDKLSRLGSVNPMSMDELEKGIEKAKSSE